LMGGRGGIEHGGGQRGGPLSGIKKKDQPGCVWLSAERKYSEPTERGRGKKEPAAEKKAEPWALLEKGTVHS